MAVMVLDPSPGLFFFYNLILISNNIFLSIYIFKNFYTIFKGYFPFTVITNYWLYSPCCTVHPWAYLIPSSLYLPSPVFLFAQGNLPTLPLLGVSALNHILPLWQWADGPYLPFSPTAPICYLCHLCIISVSGLYALLLPIHHHSTFSPSVVVLLDWSSPPGTSSRASLGSCGPWVCATSKLSVTFVFNGQFGWL